MKKNRKILLSLLTIFSLFLTTNVVNAEELQTKEEQNNVVQQESKKSAVEMTPEDVKKILPEYMEVSVTKTDYANFWLKNSEKILNADLGDEVTDPVVIELSQKFINLFKENGIDDLDTPIFLVELNNYNVVSGTGFETGYFYLANYNDSPVEFKVKYAKESNYNSSDESYVKNKVNNIKFANYEGNDAVFTMYNIGDEENASKWTEDTFDFNKLINDSSITIKRGISITGQGGGTPWGYLNTLYFYKNDVLYDIKDVLNMGAYGITLENGTPVNMMKVEKDNETYKEMLKELQNVGLSNIIDCYDLTAYGTTSNNMKVSFNIGSDYNGKEVKILHKKHDGTYETLTSAVENGKASVIVSEFSPFMIALNETNNATTTPVNNAPNNAQTSSLDIVLYSTLAIGSLLGIAYIVIKNRKKEA